MKTILHVTKILCIIILFFVSNIYSVSAQKGHNISVQIHGVEDATLILAYHSGSRKLIADSIYVDKKGKGVIKGDTLLPAGLYLILTPDMRYFEIIIDTEQHFSVETDTADLFRNLTIKGSQENIVFNTYQKKMADFHTTRRPLIEQLRAYYSIEDTTSLSKRAQKNRTDSIQIIKNTLETLRTDQLAYEDEIIAKYPKGLLTSILLTMREIDIPDYPRDDAGNILDSLYRYNYMRENYFKLVNLGDERLLRTPVYDMKLTQFFDREIIQIPDSIILEVDRIMSKILEQEQKGYEGRMYYYTLNHLFMKYQNPKYMGFDNIFVYIMEQYYMPRKIPQRIANDSAYMAQIEDRFNKMSHNRIGATAPDLLLYSNHDQWMRLSQTKAEFIVLYFYDVDCGHCKKILPEWLKYYEEHNFKEKGVVTFFIYTQTDMEKWKKYIDEQNLNPGIHVFDPYQNTNFRTLYDIYSTPVAYLLDKNKKIIAKRLPPETITDVINHEIRRRN